MRGIAVVRHASSRIPAIGAAAMAALWACLLGLSADASAAGRRPNLAAATPAQTTTFDPHKTVGVPGFLFTGNVFDTLVQLNPTPSDGRGRILPALATKWSTSSDGKQLDFTLRQGVKFHDGQVMTAKDVKFSIERAVSPEIKNPFGTTFLPKIDHVEVLTPNSVRIHLKEGWAGSYDGLAARGQIISREYMTKVGEAQFAKQPIGTGPYAFVGYRPGDFVELKAFDDYWGGKPQFERIMWRTIPDVNTRIALLQSGGADVITDVIPSLMQTVKSGGANVGVVRSSLQRDIFINTLNGGPLADKRVRMALNISFDRKALFPAVFGFEVAEIYGPLSKFQIAGDAAPPLKYDPDKAKQLLTEAGFANGFTTELIYLPGRYPGEEELLPALVSYWKKVGINVVLKQVEYNAWNTAVLNKTYPGMLSYTKGNGQVTDPLFSFVRNFKCKAVLSAYCNPEFDKFLSRADGVVDEQKIKEIFSKAQIWMQDEAPHIYLFDNPQIMGWRKGLVWKSELAPELGIPWTKLEIVQ